MDKDFDQFKNAVTTFYRKVIRVHESKLNLINSFSKMNERFITKHNGKLSLPPTMRKIKNQKDKELEKTESVSSQKSYKSVRNLPSKSMKGQYLFVSAYFERALVYGYFYNIILIQNLKLMDMIKTKVQFFLQSVKKVNDVQWDKGQLQWNKIKQLLSNKEKVKWEGILGSCISFIPKAFLNIIFKAILNSNSQLQIVPEKENLEKLATLLKLSITYFIWDNQKITSSHKYGIRKEELRIGYLTNDNKYGFFDKIPFQNSDKQSEETKTNNYSSSQRILKRSQIKEEKGLTGVALNLAKKKVIRMIDTTFQQMKLNNKKYSNLSCFQEDKKSETKSRKDLNGENSARRQK